MKSESPRWFKSSYSGNGGQCIEVATNFGSAVPVRDSKDAQGPVLSFSALSWSAFVDQVKREA
ncbi:DUF397 domain-containing protein [Streptomyces sp. NPDC090442]|uniref:DUF397 domain-containing protein n=1 Tax=Streptomyces sp. NPDC090442 TaxID=3365962 RepID=UPI003830D5C2